MASDDLNAPLGQDKTKSPSRLPVGAPQALAGVLSLCGLAVLGWAMFANDPLGGEPMAVVATKPAAGANDGARDPRFGDPAAADADSQSAKAVVTLPPPVSGKTVTIIDGSSGKRTDVVIPDNNAPAPALAQPAGPPSPAVKPPLNKSLLEMTPQGALPVIGPDGARAFAHYAKPRVLPPNRADAPRIAIVVGGLGISDSATAEAFAKLPAPVTFALAPYASGLETLAERARAAHREVLLQVPMEPFDYPNNDPGPRTLLTSLTAEQNITRLHWLMARFQGYVGLMSYMGAKFTTSEQALAPVMRDTAKRGLIFVGDGASPRSVAGQVAGSNNVPFARTDIVLDAVPTPVEINRALARLELAARDNGTAVGFASAQPAAIAAIADWARQVESRGFVLVPITMVAVKAKST